MWETGTRARPFRVVNNLIKKHLFVEVFLAFWGGNLYRWWVYRKPSTCLAKDPEFRLWMGWFVPKTIPNDYVSFRAHALVGICDREWWLPCWCYVAWSGLLLPWYCGRWWLYINKNMNRCLWRNWLVSQVIGSFSSPDWCVSWNAPRAAVSEALDALTSEEQRDIYKWQCLFQQDAHRILQDLLSVGSAK